VSERSLPEVTISAILIGHSVGQTIQFRTPAITCDRRLVRLHQPYARRTAR
jgi:hypothetical protein